VLAVDYRGHGQTRVKDANFGIYHIADDLVELLDLPGDGGVRCMISLPSAASRRHGRSRV
jgi:pimeloyl-ACP methyl ester carboxylesterase